MDWSDETVVHGQRRRCNICDNCRGYYSPYIASVSSPNVAYASNINSKQWHHHLASRYVFVYQALLSASVVMLFGSS